MPDAFSGALDSVSSPSTRGAAVAPHDVNPLPDVPKALYVGGGGSLVARGSGGGGDVAFRNLAPGTVLPFRAAFVRATGTTATDIVALY